MAAGARRGAAFRATTTDRLPKRTTISSAPRMVESKERETERDSRFSRLSSSVPRRRATSRRCRRGFRARRNGGRRRGRTLLGRSRGCGGRRRHRRAKRLSSVVTPPTNVGRTQASDSADTSQTQSACATDTAGEQSLVTNPRNSVTERGQCLAMSYFTRISTVNPGFEGERKRD